MPLFSRPARPPGVVDDWSAEPNLDLLRAIAVLCVVVRHTVAVLELPTRWWFQPQALGIFGVLIFFVHTSLVLMVSLDRQRRSSGATTARLYAAFLVRRFFRIYPLSVTAVLLTYFVLIRLGDATLLIAGISAEATPGDLAANLLLVQDLAVRKTILGPLWSLPAEVQMYLVLPALYFLVQRRGARAIAFVVWPIAVVVAVTCWKLDLRPMVGRYAPCFVAGVLCFGLLGRRRSWPFPLFPAAVVALLFAYMIVYGRVGLQAGLGIVVTIALVVLIPRFVRMRSGALRRASHAVAKYSYGVYLFHAPCLWLTFIKGRSLGFGTSLAAFLVLVAATSMLAFHFVEQPLIRVGQVMAARILERPPAFSPAPATMNGGAGPGG